MNEMNSETHSCTHSFASLDTFAVVGSEFFMMRDTFAICLSVTVSCGRRFRKATRNMFNFCPTLGGGEVCGHRGVDDNDRVTRNAVYSAMPGHPSGQSVSAIAPCRKHR